jgi:hypothetical protein
MTKNTPPEYGLSPGPMIVACNCTLVCLRADTTKHAICLSYSEAGRDYGAPDSDAHRGRCGSQIDTCQWNRSSPAGPAEQDVGGSRCKSWNAHSHSTEVRV